MHTNLSVHPLPCVIRLELVSNLLTEPHTVRMTRPCSSGGQPDRYLHPMASDAMECVDRIIAEDTSYDATTSELVTGREHLFHRALHFAGERREEEGEAGRSELVCPPLKPMRALTASVSE